MINKPRLRAPRRLSDLDVFSKFETPSPPETGTLSSDLWNDSISIAQEALNTPYIQRIGWGTLDPNNYGQYTVQDAVYCYNAIKNYKVAISKTSDPQIKAFLQDRLASYTEYKDQIFDEWHIGDPDGINPSEAAENYIAFESNVAQNMDPLYFVVAMIPCERLWSWLANQIQGKVTPGTNLYEFWIYENLGSSGADKLDNFIDEHSSQIDSAQATSVYQNCMRGEYNFFQSAASQEIKPIDIQI